MDKNPIDTENLADNLCHLVILGKNEEQFRKLAKEKLYELTTVLPATDRDISLFVKYFTEVVWQLEKLCQFSAKYPVEASVRPDFSVYTFLGLAILSAFFKGNREYIKKIIRQGLSEGLIFARFAWLLLAELANEENDYQNYYLYAKNAFGTFSHCGASYRALHDAWEKCLENGIKVENGFPSSQELKNKFCSYPFEYLMINTNDSNIILTPCYTSFWLSYAKSVNDQEKGEKYFDLWNCAEFQEIRRSILEGDYSYCSKMKCPRILNLPDKGEVTDNNLKKIIANRITKLKTGPKHLIMAYDKTCNLACPSCRKEHFMITPDTAATYERMTKSIVGNLLDNNIKELTCNCSGEALASRHTLRFLNALDFTKYPQLKINLMTNAELLPARWDQLGEARKHIQSLIISFDALSAFAYAKIRGGNLSKFIEGLEFAAGLKKQGRINKIRAVTTVQEINMRELPDIYIFCEEHGFDILSVNKMQNWGTFTGEEFKLKDVWDMENPNFQEWKSIHAHLSQMTTHMRTKLILREIEAEG